MSVILGIDPGSRITGYGVVSQTGSRLTYLASGCIRIRQDSLPLKLKQIYSGVSRLILEFHPRIFVIEQVFMAKNADSALKLGQARGSAILAATNADLPVYEYAAKVIKKSVVGTGAADKYQVQRMVQLILNLPERPQSDAADALGIAICHANTSKTLSISGRISRTLSP